MHPYRVLEEGGSRVKKLPLQFPLVAKEYEPSPESIARLRALGGGMGLLGGAALVAGFFFDPEHFLPSYLVGWLLVFTVASGCLGLLLLHHLSGGRWGLVLRRQMEAASRTIPYLAVALLPCLFGLDRLFEWADLERVASDHLLHHKAPYLNVPFFVGRTLGILGVFTALAWVLSRLSLAQDRAGDQGAARRMRQISAVGLLFFVFATSFFGFDWLMSLQPHYFSSLYGAIFLAGEGLAGLSFLILSTRYLASQDRLASVVARQDFHDFGKLLFAFVLFFTYLAISQFIITYQGNLPEEVVWYQLRFGEGWGWVAAGLLVFHFFFPFLILLSRSVKENGRTLSGVALWVLFMRYVDLIWNSRPALTHGHFSLHWLDLAAPLGIGGLWLVLYSRQLTGKALLPVNDPYLKEALAHD